MEFPFNTEKSIEKSHLRPPDFASASTRWKIATGTTENRRKNQTSSRRIQRVTGRESRVLGSLGFSGLTGRGVRPEQHLARRK